MTKSKRKATSSHNSPMKENLQGPTPILLTDYLVLSIIQIKYKILISPLHSRNHLHNDSSEYANITDILKEQTSYLVTIFYLTSQTCALKIMLARQTSFHPKVKDKNKLVNY